MIYANTTLTEKTFQLLLRDSAINVPTANHQTSEDSPGFLRRNLYFVDRKLTDQHFELSKSRERRDLSDDMTAVIDGLHPKASGVHFHGSVLENYYSTTGIERQSLAQGVFVAISFYKYLLGAKSLDVS